MVWTFLTQLKRTRAKIKHLKGYGSFSNMGKRWIESEIKLSACWTFGHHDKK